MNATQFNAAVDRAKTGEAIAYHSGFLFIDRQRRTDVDEIGRAAWAAHEAGTVFLFQRRVDGTTCQYLAVRAPRK